MSLFRHITSGLRALFQKERVDRELDEELRAYQEMAAEEKVKQGMSRQEALRAIRLEQGSLELTKEVVRYVPYWQRSSGAIEFALKTTNDAAAIGPAIRSVIRNIDAELPVSDLRTMDQIVEGSLAPRRFQTDLVLAFGAAAVLLACLGVYGVMSFFVTQRTTEIGIRLAFGAEPREVLRMVLRQAMRPVAAGVVAAVPLAFLAGSWLRSLVFGVSPQDPRTIAVACFVLVVAAALAAYLPARRAAHLDPLNALRYE